jgi:hypothetical protein
MVCGRIYSSVSTVDFSEFHEHVLSSYKNKTNPNFFETLAYKKPMDVYQESIKLNQEKSRAS